MGRKQAIRCTVRMAEAASAAALCVCHLTGCAKIEPVRPALGAFERVEAICAIGPRESGTIGAAEAAAWIAAELDAAGLFPVTDSFSDKTASGEKTFRNVTATITGTTKKHILLLSHYDTKSGVGEGFAGANDGGSSTALLLSLAKWFRANPPDGATLTFAFLDGEECETEYGPRDGLHGSHRLAAQMKGARTRLDAVILLDMVGDADLTLTIPSNSDPRLVATLMQSAKRLGMAERVRRKPEEMLDDHQPFLELGYPAIDIIDFEYGSAPGLNDYWHTPEDTLDKLSDETLDAVGALVIDMANNL